MTSNLLSLNSSKTEFLLIVHQSCTDRYKSDIRPLQLTHGPRQGQGLNSEVRTKAKATNVWPRLEAMNMTSTTPPLEQWDGRLVSAWSFGDNTLLNIGERCTLMFKSIFQLLSFGVNLLQSTSHVAQRHEGVILHNQITHTAILPEKKDTKIPLWTVCSTQWRTINMSRTFCF